MNLQIKIYFYKHVYPWRHFFSEPSLVNMQGPVFECLNKTLPAHATESTFELAMRFFGILDTTQCNIATVNSKLEIWSEKVAQAVLDSRELAEPHIIKETALRCVYNARKLGDLMLFEGQTREGMSRPVTVDQFEDGVPISLYNVTDLNNVLMCMNAIRIYAQLHNLRKVDDEYFIPIHSPGGQFMNFHKRAGHLTELISEITGGVRLNAVCDSKFESISKLAKSIAKRAPDPYFPTLVRDKHVFTFRNCVIMLGKNEAADRFPSVNMYKFDNLPPRLPGSAAFHDVDIDERWVADANDGVNFARIPTPYCDKVLGDQDISGADMIIVYGLLGRLFFDLGEHDDWQVMPYFHGLAGTGKSTLITLCQSLYEIDDVFSIHTNFEGKFGLSNVFDKFMWAAPDVKEVFPLDRALLQSMVSGENIGVSVKYKKATSGKWKVPGIMAGNRLPNYQDTAGSISRRIALIRFLNATERDDKLAARLQEERGAFLIKAVACYRILIGKVNDTYFGSIVSQMLKNGTTFLNMHVNVPYAFITSKRCAQKKSAYYELKAFEDALIVFSKSQGTPLPTNFSCTLVEDLRQHAITTDTGLYPWPPDKQEDVPIANTVLFGVTAAVYAHLFPDDPPSS